MGKAYKLVVAEDAKVLEEGVNRYIEAGFIPTGELVVSGCKLIQVMTFNVNPELNINTRVNNNF